MIGVDIGGTNILVGKIENGKVVDRKHATITDKDPYSVVELVSSVIESFNADFSAVGIAVAGSVNSERGEVIRGENLNWDNVPLASLMCDALNTHVSIENDVSAAAWGEFTYGAGKDMQDMFAVWIGTGIGGGLILNNTLWTGPMGTGGEFGMGISETNEGSPTRTLEGFASRSGYQRMLADDSISTAVIQSSFMSGNELDLLIQDGAKRIGTSIANVVTLLSLDCIVLGGGITEKLGNQYIELIQSQFKSDVFPSSLQTCSFKMTQLGPDAGLLGAAAIATQRREA